MVTRRPGARRWTRPNDGQAGFGSTAAFSPAQISGLVAYMDARYIADVTLTAGAVSTWANHAGSGGAAWNLTDGGTSSRRPAYSTGYSIDFDGTNHWLSGAGASLPEPYTFLIGVRILPGAAADICLSDGTSINTGFMDINNTATGTVQIYNGTSFVSAAGMVTIGTQTAIAGVYNGTNSVIYPRLQPATTGDVGNVSTRSGWTLAARGNGSVTAKISVYWVALYSRALTVTEIDTIFSHLP